MQIRIHLIGIQQGWDTKAGRVQFQAVCEDCTWSGPKGHDQEAAEESLKAHRDSGEPINGLAAS